MTRHTASIFVVEDNELCLRSIYNHCIKYAPVITASTVQQGLKVIKHDLLSAIIDISLPDGSGLTLLRCLRKGNKSMPVLIFSCNLSPDTINAVYGLDAEVVHKEGGFEHLDRFLRRTTNYPKCPSACLSKAIDEKSTSWKLTAQQKIILHFIIEGVRPAEIPNRLNISKNTFKTHSRFILRKSDHQTLWHAARDVFMYAISINKTT